MNTPSNKFTFTTRKLDQLKTAGTYYDTHPNSKGLYLEIRTDGGRGTFKLKGRIGNKQIKVSIGRYPLMTIEQARRKALAIQNDLANGINPNIKKQSERTKHITLLEFFKTVYLPNKNLKPKTIEGYFCSMRNVLEPLAQKEIVSISYNDVLKTHQAYSTKSQNEADRAMRLLKAVINMAMDKITDLDGHPLILKNPVRELTKNKHTKRPDRKTSKLEDDQIKPFFDFMEAMTKDKRPYFQTGADLALILFFHGTRFTETASLTWTQIDLKYKRFYLSETKNSRRLWLPMTDQSERIFKRRKSLNKGGDYVFPAVTDTSKHLTDIKKPLRALLEQTSVSVTPHDLRRTFLNTGARLGFNNSILKQLANHAIGEDVTDGYIIQSVDDLREPSQRITTRYLELAGQTSTNADTQLKELLNTLAACRT